ncbi:MAG: WD40 repeat domain-containing protein, partial [Anaerolineae bacterium]
MLVGVTAVALLLALWALFNRQQAIQNAAQAETQQQIAASRELAAAALNTLTIDPELSVLLALQAVALTDTIEAQTALHQTLPALNLRQTLRGHEDLIQGLSISADGTKIATAAIDNTVRLWDPVRGDLLLTLADVHHDPMAVAFHPGGDQLLTSGLADGQAALWQLAEGGENGVTAALIYTVEVGESGIVAAAFSPDGSKIAVGLNDGTIKMLQAESGAALWQSPGHTPQPATTIIGVLGVTDVAFHPNGSLLAASGTDGAITLWDVANGERLASVTEDRSVMALDFSADGAQLAAAGEDGTVKAWQVDPETQALTIDLVLATEATDVAFSADGRFLATASGAGFSTLWEVASGRRVQDFFGHSGAVMELKFMPDSTQLVTASEDKTIKLWDLVPGREWMTVMGAMNPAFTPDGRFLATTDPAGALTLWERETGRAAQQLPLSELPLNAVAFSADGSLVAGTAVDNSVTIRTFPALEPVLAIPPQPVRVWHVQFSPTAATAAVSNELGVVQLWDMVAGEVLFTWQASMGPVSQLSFSPDGALVATGGWDGAVALWDTASGTQVAARQLDVEALDVAFSPDGGRLAVADRSGGIA